MIIIKIIDGRELTQVRFLALSPVSHFYGGKKYISFIYIVGEKTRSQILSPHCGYCGSGKCSSTIVVVVVVPLRTLQVLLIHLHLTDSSTE